MKNLIIHTHHEILSTLQIKEDEIDWICSTHGKNDDDDDAYKMFIGSHEDERSIRRHRRK
jgi:hypothetical protein